jgi:cell division protein FtsB
MIRNRRLSFLTAPLFALIGLSATPVQAQSVDELQRQLQAQQEINVQLRGRIQTLEAEIEELQADILQYLPIGHLLRLAETQNELRRRKA